ncbi:hypothetical protein ACFL6S_05545 [Candidatus Poribacteria bacterium]
MKNRSIWIALMVAIVAFVGSFQNSDAFLGRKYTLREVISESTNIFFGTLTSVDRESKQAIVEIEENVRGKSNLTRMKLNVATGEWRDNLTSPDKLMKSLKVGNPIVVFTRHQGQALGHAGGTWFQMLSYQEELSPDVWWNFTHIGLRLNRSTYRESTRDFQKHLLKVLKPFKYAEPNDVKVLVFTKHQTAKEFIMLSSFRKIAGRAVVYKPTRFLKPSDMDKADILWIGYRSVSRTNPRKRLYSDEAEERIREFVRRGGTVIISGQDSDPKRPCEIGFLPEPMVGVEREAGSGIHPIANHDLFTTPKLIQTDLIRVDDAWTTTSEDYSVLASTPDGHIAAAKLTYGRGMYIIAAMQNGRTDHLKTNAPLMRNLIYQAISVRSETE